MGIFEKLNIYNKIISNTMNNKQPTQMYEGDLQIQRDWVEKNRVRESNFGSKRKMSKVGFEIVKSSSTINVNSTPKDQTGSPVSNTE